MSNTSHVSPYESEESAPSSASAAIDDIAAVVQWLREETPEEQAIRENLAVARRRERLGTSSVRIAAPPALTRVRLHLRESASLVKSAESLGFRPVISAGKREALSARVPILLQGAAGERLAITRNARGRIVVQTTSPRVLVERIVRQHTVDRLTVHLATKGMRVQQHSLPNGEIDVLACEVQGCRPDGQATVATKVGRDGRATVDIGGLRSSRCDGLLSEMAQAMGAEVVQSKRKRAPMQLPGESTKSALRLK